METKLTRPDLSFLTGLNSKIGAYSKYHSWYYASDNDNDSRLIQNAQAYLPELIQIAEMYFDEKKSNPESSVFQMVSKVLNDIKPDVK